MKVVWTAICVGVLAGVLSAQNEAKGKIRGTVVDEAGAVIPRAAVLLVDLNTMLAQRVTTDQVGEFEFGGLALDHEYMVVSRSQCFKPKIVRKVKPGSKALRIKLGIGGNEGCETVTVTSVSPCLRGEIGRSAG